jgi:O-antigen/teichoic acid export membrane protein
MITQKRFYFLGLILLAVLTPILILAGELLVAVICGGAVVLNALMWCNKESRSRFEEMWEEDKRKDPEERTTKLALIINIFVFFSLALLFPLFARIFPNAKGRWWFLYVGFIAVLGWNLIILLKHYRNKQTIKTRDKPPASDSREGSRL